jgi:hypothetical protein
MSLGGLKQVRVRNVEVTVPILTIATESGGGCELTWISDSDFDGKLTASAIICSCSLTRISFSFLAVND